MDIKIKGIRLNKKYWRYDALIQSRVPTSSVKLPLGGNSGAEIKYLREAS